MKSQYAGSFTAVGRGEKARGRMTTYGFPLRFKNYTDGNRYLLMLAAATALAGAFFTYLSNQRSIS